MSDRRVRVVARLEDRSVGRAAAVGVEHCGLYLERCVERRSHRVGKRPGAREPGRGCMEAAPHRHDDGHDELLDGHAGRKRMPEPLDPLVAANDEADRDRVHSFEVLGDTRLEVEVALSRHPGGDHGLQRAGCVRAEPGEALSLARQQPEPECREIVLVGRELRPPPARDRFGRLREGVRVVPGDLDEREADLLEPSLCFEARPLHRRSDSRDAVLVDDEPEQALGVAPVDRVRQTGRKPSDRRLRRQRNSGPAGHIESFAEERELRFDLMQACATVRCILSARHAA